MIWQISVGILSIKFIVDILQDLFNKFNYFTDMTSFLFFSLIFLMNIIYFM